MRKIYPPPFNKFVVFVFYGLLSIAVIVSAQGPYTDNDCNGLNKITSNNNRQVIGYVQPNIDPNTIQWELYDYINYIVDDFISNDPDKYSPMITALINAKNDNGKNVKVLLSIKNYDLQTWNDKPKGFYGNLANNIINFINTNNLDGVDIEYPGMRGIPCNYNNFNDAGFTGFIKNLKGKLKTVMLTVGGTPSEAIRGFVGQDGNIDLLNIETYHYSLYSNPTGQGYTNPNSPYWTFTQAYNYWISSGISNEKILMGIDFGNTFQFVSNEEIKYNQTVVYDITSYELPPEIKDQLIPINSLCNVQTLTTLYSWPWKSLSIYALDSPTNGLCNTKNGWTRKFDHPNSVPWLYRNYDVRTPFNFFYVSYEDFSSLYIKISSSTVGGISISDISYDDYNNTLINYIRGNQILPSPVDLPPKNPNSDNHKASNGIIAGAVLGGLLLIVVSCFVWYRRRYILSKNDAITKSTMRSHTTTKNIEMSCDSPRFAAPTTVIPVACGYVTAMFDFEGKEENDLSFKKGDKIEVLERGDGPNDWWVGRVNNTVGEFPGNYVKETG
ncbi:hypothetical protein RclHR1_10330004 [Rhizophagus clarus]|uniref:Uncharacterized protein n=1 Tax=Rhizophagus clarus TaxID=94130 RepID=A0A2Z6QFH6_9GLOM|nr:hypothetical protein RclHR1_10330004 [Rhizophagus clarus]